LSPKLPEIIELADGGTSFQSVNWSAAQAVTERSRNDWWLAAQ